MNIINLIADDIPLKDGFYSGVWGGWSLIINGNRYRTIKGIKTMNYHINVEVINSKLYFLRATSNGI